MQAFVVLAAAWVLLLAPAGLAQETTDGADGSDAYQVYYPEVQNFRTSYENALKSIPRGDISWIALRSVVGPGLWDGAARFTPNWFLAPTFPQIADVPNKMNFLGSVGLMDLDPIAETDQDPAATDDDTSPPGSSGQNFIPGNC